jgi:hypothetical protein
MIERWPLWKAQLGTLAIHEGDLAEAENRYKQALGRFQGN